MTLAFASRLPGSGEYAIASWGQSNGNPKGLLSDAIPYAPQFALTQNGLDLTVTSISGSTVNVSDALTASTLVGMELRLIRPTYGQADCPAHVGVGTVTANTASALTVTWTVSPSIPVANTGGFTFDASNVVGYVGHAYKNGDRVVFSGAPLGAGVTAGTTYYVINRTANNFQIATDLGGSAVTFGTAIAGATITPKVGAYVHWTDGRGLSWSNVRVLTPYMPEAFGVYPSGAPSVPNRSFPASITGYADAALFLDFTFNEGVEGYGVTGSGGTVTYSTNSLTDTALALDTDILVGATVQIGARIYTVASNTATTITFTENLSPAPSNGTEYEGSVWHYRDNPHARTVGFGFRYPSNHTQPGLIATTGYTYCRPRGRLSPLYVPVSGSGAAAVPAPRFGHMVMTAWRLATLIGRRVNVVHLANDASSLERSTLHGGAPSDLGWYTVGVLRDWITGAGDNLAARFERLLTAAAPAALTAEGSTRSLRFLGAVGFQGESETLSSSGTIYGTLLAAFYHWLRRTVHSAGLSHYSDPEDMPAAHAGLGTAWQAVDTAGGGYVQAAIDNWAALDPAGTTFDTSDSDLALPGDPAHFNGIGEVENGILAGNALAALVDAAVSQGVDESALNICNLALTMVGEPSIFSVDPTQDQSTQAQLCARFYPEARNRVLEGHSFAFATRFAELEQVTNDRDDWAFCYALPKNMLAPLSLTYAGSSAASVSAPTELVPVWRSPTAQAEASQVARSAQDQPFSIERNGDGYLVLYTNVDDAVLRYNCRIDGVQTPSNYRRAVARELASLLIGTLVKGEAGVAAAAKLGALAREDATTAAGQDANRQQAPARLNWQPWDR